MSAQETTTFTFAPKIDPERALRLGAAAAVAPLWAGYFAAASTGVAYWWMTSWTRRDQSFFAPKALAKPVKAAVEIVEAPVEAAAEIVEAAPKAIEAPKAVEAAPAEEPMVKAKPKTVSAASKPSTVRRKS